MLRVQRQAADLDRHLGLGVALAFLLVVVVVDLFEVSSSDSNPSGSSASSPSSAPSGSQATVAAVTVSASSTGATSWTRNTRAPRSYASTSVATVAAEPLGRIGAAGQPPEKALTARPDQDGTADRDQLRQPAQQLEIVLGRLAEPDPRVEQDPLLGDAMVGREAQPLLQERLDLGDDVVVARIALHRPRRAEHVHQAQLRSVLPDELGDLRRRPQRRDVVDHRRTRLERGRRRPSPWRCRSRSGPPRPRYPGNQPLDHRQHPAQLLARRSTGSAPGRVDSPPISRIAAPSALQLRPWPIAASRLEVPPPSENESGVTLTTPITRTRLRRSRGTLSRRLGHCASGSYGLVWPAAGAGVLLPRQPPPSPGRCCCRRSSGSSS